MKKGVIEIENGPIQYGVQFNENAIKEKSQQDVASNSNDKILFFIIQTSQ